MNYTAGLCKVRTSPDHGVAYDIAGRDKADPQSMRNAIYAALDIVENRRRWAAMSADPLQHFERDRGRDASAKDLPEMREGRHDDRFMHRNMARRDDGFQISTRRKVAWMFFGLWAVVLVMAAARYAVHGDMVVTLAVARGRRLLHLPPVGCLSGMRITEGAAIFA